MTAADALLGARKALVVPALETPRYHSRHLPNTKAAAVSAMDMGELFSFRFHEWPRGHAATDFPRWRASTEPFSVKWTRDFEPYVVVLAEDLPPFDERFSGFGWNKVLINDFSPHQDVIFLSPLERCPIPWSWRPPATISSCFPTSSSSTCLTRPASTSPDIESQKSSEGAKWSQIRLFVTHRPFSQVPQRSQSRICARAQREVWKRFLHFPMMSVLITRKYTRSELKAWRTFSFSPPPSSRWPSKSPSRTPARANATCLRAYAAGGEQLEVVVVEKPDDEVQHLVALVE